MKIIKMDFKLLLEELRNFNLQVDQFAITSSGTLAVRNIREATDLDIIVTDTLWGELIKKYPINKDGDFESINVDNIQFLHKGSWFTGNNEKMIREADIIDGIRYVKLEEIRKRKTNRDREKDIHDVELIKNYLGLKP